MRGWLGMVMTGVAIGGGLELGRRVAQLDKEDVATALRFVRLKLDQLRGRRRRYPPRRTVPTEAP